MLFNTKFKGDQNSIDFKIWQNLKLNEKNINELESAYINLNPGKKFKAKFNSQNHFLNLLFELYIYVFLKSKNVISKSETSSNGQIDLLFQIQNKRVACECKCINTPEADETLSGKVEYTLNDSGLIDSSVKSPPAKNDKMMLKSENRLEKRRSNF